MQILFCHSLAMCLLVSLIDISTFAFPSPPGARPEKLRTIVTTDMEQDDLASLIRYLLYTNEIETQGIIYSSSRYHWAGDGKGTAFFHPDRPYTTPQTSYRWTGTRTIQDKVLPAYAQAYSNLRCHDPSYPTPEELLPTVKIGNIDFEGEMDHDTDGSNLIRSLLLDDDPRPVYLQAWGGTNTIARALSSIEDQYSKMYQWEQIWNLVSSRAVILASGFQDDTYANYIALHWPQIRVEDLSAGYNTWGYNCNEDGKGNVRGLGADHVYFTGSWIRPNIEMGPFGKLYRSWLDGQVLPGDPLDVFGNLSTAANLTWCVPLGPYDFLSEGDNVAFNPLLVTGIQDPANPNLGGWGGRAEQNNTSQNLWTMVATEKNSDGVETQDYTTDRWMAPVQNDFAARMQWTVTPEYRGGNHPPKVEILHRTTMKACPMSVVRLVSKATDPDQDNLTITWWQYLEEGTYPGTVAVNQHGQKEAEITIPADAKPGQTISIIVEATDDGYFPLTRYDRAIIHVI